jgi:non-specific serine/threonine protein kinase
VSQSDRNLVYESGQWQVHLGRRELLAGGVPVLIGDRAFEIVEVLVRSANELVTKDDLMGRIWPGVIVGENTIQVHISAIRKALGQDRAMLKTASGRGYRLLGNWTARHHETATPSVGLQQIRTTGATAATNLPAAVTRLIGRSAAEQRLRDLVSAWRAVTLTGPGGIWKTTLALEVARGLLSGFDGGGWFVELASLSDPDLVPSAVASVLGLKISGGTMSAGSVARAIGGQHLLLVLDNCEHVIDAVANLTEVLVRRCPRTTIMATSREVLRIDGEYVFRVPSLEAPAADTVDPDHILGHSAVELFIARTQALESDFVARADDLPTIAAICRRLDGMPLAIEFAAARAAMLGIQQVAIGLRDRFALLTGGRRTALPRHRTLRAVLDWSHELLTEAERLLLRRMAIFPAGFTFDAVAAVMHDSGLGVAAITDGIANLVAKSLLLPSQSETGDRWYLLETTRAYALGKLGDSGEAGQTARFHAQFYLALFAPFATEGQLQVALDNLARYRRELDNFRAALTWAFSPDGDTATRVALAVVGADFWAGITLLAEGCEWAGDALARLGAAAGTRSEMILQCSLGMTLIFTRGMVGPAREALTRGLALARTIADFDYQQRATLGLWLFAARSSALEDALAIARPYETMVRPDDRQSQAVADWLIGIPQIYFAEHIEASTRLQRAIDQYPIESRGRDTIRFGGDLLASASGHVSVSLLSRGLVNAATRAATRAVEEARGTNQPAVLCVALAWAAGFIFLSLGELEMAERYGEELIIDSQKHELRPFHAAGLCVRGSLAVRRGAPDFGVDLLRRGLADMRATAYLLFYPFFLVELAAALGALGRIDEGLAEIGTALRFATETGHRWFVPETLRVNGQLFALRDPDDPEVENCFNRGAKVAREQNALFWELRLALSLARLRMTQGRHSEARQILAPVYDRFTEGFATSDLRAAKALLDALTP